MKPKISAKLIFGVAGIAFFSAIIFFPISYFSSQTFYAKPESAQGVAPEETVSSGLPVRLKIPKINVDAAVQYVGVDASGTMIAPSGLKDVAWLKTGTKPGNIGSAVIAGHYGTKSGIVFNDLYKLKKGDDVYVEDDKGEKLHFVVRESRTYDPKADASDVFNSSDGKAHLNLVTCEGTWDSVRKTYSNRLIVFADKE